VVEELVKRFPLLADHGQFYASDASHNPCTPLPEISDEEVRRGWARTDYAIHYYTVGQLWAFRLDLICSSAPPGLDGAERVLSHTLRLPTGILAVGNDIAANNMATIAVAPDTYSVFLRAFNLGAKSDLRLDDPELLERADLERYEMFVVRGAAKSEGVILGRATLW